MKNKKLIILLGICLVLIILFVKNIFLINKSDYLKFSNDNIDPIQQGAIDNSPYVTVTDSDEEMPSEINELITKIKEDNNYSVEGTVFDISYDEEEDTTYYSVSYGEYIWYIYRLMEDNIIYSYPDPHNNLLSN